MDELKRPANEMKQIIVMRKDLNMRKGKMVAQGAHASMGALLHGTTWGPLGFLLDKRLRRWLKGPFTKVCLYVESEDELIEIGFAAREAGLIWYGVTDAGKTEFHGEPTRTCCAIGPATDAELKPVTGALKLL